MPWTNEQLTSAASLLPYFIGPVPAIASALTEGVHSNEDMEAINTYMQNAQPVTPDAVNALADWTAWWATLDWVDKNISTKAFDTARNKFNAFVVANQPTVQGKSDIKQILAQGITTEEMEGGERRADAEGNFPVEKPKTPVQKWTMYAGIALGGSVLIGLTLGIAKLVSNPLALMSKH